MAVTYKGRRFNAGQFSADLQASILESVKAQLHERFSSLRHPGTGEFPTVQVLGNEIDDLRLLIEGSPELLAHVKERMSPEDQESTTFMAIQEVKVPKVFLSYAFDDGDMARRIANAMTEKGIDVWWAGWEMKAGDSLRQRIEEGLADCTHFVVLLTRTSINKPWVQQEMDAGLVKRIAGQTRFIALRAGVPTVNLPPLISGMLSPEIADENFETGIRDLINDIHGVSRKPPLGAAPAATSLPNTGYTKTATAIAKIFVEKSEIALFGDPEQDMDDLASAVGVSVEDVEDALHELRDMLDVSFDSVLPQATLFAAFDKHFMEWSPEADALKIAADLINDTTLPDNTEDVAQRYGWSPRRMNPALAYLLSRKLIVDYGILDSVWHSYRIVSTDATRRFVKSRS